MPWSATTTTSASSYRPSRRSRATQLAEQPVGQPELEQVPLVRDLHQPRHAEPDHAVEPGDRLGREAPVAVPEG